MHRKKIPEGEVSHEALIQFLRETILKDWGDRDVAPVDELSVLTNFISPQPFVAFRFVKKVLGDSICTKIKEYGLEADEVRGKLEASAESVRLYDLFFRFFNPDVLYSQCEVPKLFVLERKSLADAQIALLVQRCESWLKVLYDLEDKEGVKQREGWGGYLSKTLEHLIAKAEPNVVRPFVRKGEVTGFFERNLEFVQPFVDGSNDLTGLAVAGFEHPNPQKSDIYHTARLILTDTRSPERFEHLIGQTVNYHFEGWFEKYNEYGALRLFPHGRLVSVP